MTYQDCSAFGHFFSQKKFQKKIILPSKKSLQRLQWNKSLFYISFLIIEFPTMTYNCSAFGLWPDPESPRVDVPARVKMISGRVPWSRLLVPGSLLTAYWQCLHLQLLQDDRHSIQCLQAQIHPLSF